MIGWALEGQDQCFVQILLGVLVNLGGHVDGRFGRDKANRFLAEFELELFFVGEREKILEGVIGIIDQLALHAVVDDHIEPDGFLNEARRDLLQSFVNLIVSLC